MKSWVVLFHSPTRESSRKSLRDKTTVRQEPLRVHVYRICCSYVTEVAGKKLKASKPPIESVQLLTRIGERVAIERSQRIIAGAIPPTNLQVCAFMFSVIERRK